MNEIREKTVTTHRAAPTASNVIEVNAEDSQRRSFVSTIWNALTVVRPEWVSAKPQDVLWVRRPRWRIISFVLLVMLPSLACQIYLAFIAADKYVAEARFAVRTAEVSTTLDDLKAEGTGGGLALMTTTSASFSQNAYIVSNYIRSRALVEDIQQRIDLREIYRRPESDFWARLSSTASIEELHDYWQSMVDCYVDGPSGIVRLQILAFRKEDAVTIANLVLQLSERLVNDISTRSRADAMQWAEGDVRRADGEVRAALAELRRYRDSEGIIDPVKTADATGKQLTTLVGEKIKLESDLFVAGRSLFRDSPTVQNLRNRLDSLEVQINTLKAQLTGTSSTTRSVSSSLARFEQLELQRLFAEKLYTLAQDSLERSRIMAERQSVYLTVFVPPAIPQDASYPRRLAYSLALPVIFFIFWGIGSLTAASVEDHRL